MRKRYLIAILGLLGWGFNSSAQEAVSVDKVVSVYDGDTMRVNVSGWPPVVGQNMPIRLRGVDTPEIRGKCQEEKRQAYAARNYVRERVAQAHAIELRNIERGKYFRLVADVYLDGVLLSNELTAAGLARNYDGGRRSPWCQSGK